MSVLAYPHIEIRPGGVPYIADTETKVVEIVLDRLAYHWDADEIQRQHTHLSLSQIYSALAYYYDHQTEIDQVIADRLQQEETAISNLGESSVRLKLQKLKSKRRQA